MSDRDFNINITADAQEAVEAARQTKQGLEQTAAACAKAADEAQRYEAALRQMEIASKVAEQGQRNLAAAASATADDSARYQAALEGMSQRGGPEGSKALNPFGDGWASGVAERREAIKKEGQAGAAAMHSVTQETNKAVGAQARLKAAVKGLAYEYPILGRLATLALNPITLAVAGTAGAFTLWEMRMKAAMETLGGIELPEITDDKLKTYDTAADAWEKFAEKVRQTVEAYNSVLAASERMEKQIDKQAEREKKRLANQKTVDMATLEMASLEKGEGKLSPAEYAARKAALESKYEAGEMAIEERAEQRKLAEKGRRFKAMHEEAATKEGEAFGITAGSEAKEARIEQLQRAAAEAALKKQEEAKKRLERLNEMSVDAGTRAKYTPWFAMQYGVGTTGSEARAMEQVEIARNQPVLDQYDSWQRSKRGRADARSRRDQLLDEAASGRGKAYELGRELPGMVQDFNEDRTLNRETLSANSIGRGAQALGEANKAQAQLAQESEKWMKSAGAIPRIVQEHARQTSAVIEEMERQLKTEQARMWNAISDTRRR